MSLRLQIVTCSTRPGRVGPVVADWFLSYAQSHGGFECKAVDLAEFNFPVYDEPYHPRMQNYQKEHTKRWSATVAAADAYVFVTPEYNYGPTPALSNALNYVYREWNYKPCGFVSYGGVSGGLRGVQMVKPLVTTLKMMPMTEGVAVPMVAQQIDESGRLTSNELIDASAKTLLDELLIWAKGLKSMREQLAA